MRVTRTTVTLVSLRGNEVLQAVDAASLGITIGGKPFHVTERTVAARRADATLKESRPLNRAVNADDHNPLARAIYLEPDLTVQVIAKDRKRPFEYKGRTFKKMVIVRT